MPLSDLVIRRAQSKPAPYKLSDELGLYLLVQPNGAMWWRFDYRFDRKRKTLSLGVYPKVSLTKARGGRDDARQLLAQGIDPGEQRKKAKQTPPEEITFEKVGREWHTTRKGTWSPDYAQRILNRLEKDVFPVIGHLPIGEIGVSQVLDMLRKVEARGVGETVYRVKDYVSEIFAPAVALGLAAADPVYAIDKGKMLKPKPRKQHRAALKAVEFPQFLARLANSDLEIDTKEALLLTLLTVVRTDELRFARIEEAEDLEGKAPLWRIPADRMKPHGSSGIRTEHVIPLPTQAAALWRRRRDRLKQDSGLLFPQDSVSGVISENRMLYGMYRLGYHSKATVHGFRGSFSTIANEAIRIVDGEEVRMWDSDWIERQLHHVDTDEVRSSYNAAKYLQGRRRMLQWWADWLDAQQSAGLMIG